MSHPTILWSSQARERSKPRMSLSEIKWTLSILKKMIRSSRQPWSLSSNCQSRFLYVWFDRERVDCCQLCRCIDYGGERKQNCRVASSCSFVGCRREWRACDTRCVICCGLVDDEWRCCAGDGSYARTFCCVCFSVEDAVVWDFGKDSKIHVVS